MLGFLHKFRHTFATRNLQDGIDIRTLQQWMGHRFDLVDIVEVAGPQHVRFAEITSFVINRIAALRDLLNSDVTQARVEFLKHVTEIRLCPKRTEAGTDYVAVREWNLLGNYPEMDRARHLHGVCARLVAGARNVPNALIVPFRIELHRPAA